MGTLRWVGVPEGEVRLVEGTCEDAKSRVLCEPGVSGESKVSVQLKEVKVSSYIAQYPPQDCSKRFTLYFPGSPIQSDTISGKHAATCFK